MKANSNNINNGKSNKTKSVITLTSLIIILSIVNITLLTGTIFGININTTNANALSYSTSEDISFTFKPTLSIGLSTNNLTIDNLVPGTTNDSNTVTVTVSSNTPYGYVLSAGVGSTESSDPYYNTSDLVHDNSTTQVPTTNKFSSIATSASLPTLDTDNTWGYSTSTNGGTSWSTYSGLSHTATKPLLDISDPATPSTIDFKIAARSATTQASGTYNNVITFYAVGKPEPITIDSIEYLQDFTLDPESIKSSMEEHVVYTKKDKRDEQEYTIAKLKDGKIWMTKNLNLAGGSVINSELSDVPDGYTLPTSSGFKSENRLPNSSTSFGADNTKAKLYNSTRTTGNGCSKPGCYSYYSWTAATAGSGLSISAENTDAPYSICPKGWKLPNSRTTSASDWQSANFYQLAVAYGMDPNSTSQFYSNNFYIQAGSGTVANFLLTGYYNSSSFNFGNSDGYYWSSTSSSRFDARILYFTSLNVDSANYYNRRYGFAVRCIAE